MPTPPNKNPLKTPITTQFAPWVQETHLQFLQAYTAATDTQKNKAILSCLDPEDAAYITVDEQSRTSDVLHTFLTSSNSFARLQTLEKMLCYTQPRDPIDIQAETGKLSLITNSPLGLLVSLFPALTNTPGIILEKSQKIHDTKKKAEQALSEYFKALGPELSDECIGRNILPFAAKMISNPSYVSKRERSKLAPEMKIAMDKLHEFTGKNLLDIYVAGLDRLLDIRGIYESELYLSNKSKPSLKLFKIRSITYGLLNIMSSEAITNTAGAYSLIAYLASLSLGIDPKSNDMITASSVKQNVITAIKIWIKNKPSNNSNSIESNPEV